MPPQPRAKDNYPWHLNNRNKRGLALDLKSPEAAAVVERLVKWADVVIVNTPHPAREKLKLAYDDVKQWNPRVIYADVTGYGDKGPDADLPGFDITAYWARTGLLSADQRRGCSTHTASGGQRRSCDCRQSVLGDCHGALPPRADRRGCVRHDVAARVGRLGRGCPGSGGARRRDFPRARRSA
jgi:hypothetical protein